MTVRKKPANGSSLKWKGSSGRPKGRVVDSEIPEATTHIPAIVATRDAIAVKEKEDEISSFWSLFNSSAMDEVTNRIAIEERAIPRGVMSMPFLK